MRECFLCKALPAHISISPQLSSLYQIFCCVITGNLDMQAFNISLLDHSQQLSSNSSPCCCRQICKPYKILTLTPPIFSTTCCVQKKPIWQPCCSWRAFPWTLLLMHTCSRQCSAYVLSRCTGSPQGLLRSGSNLCWHAAVCLAASQIWITAQ